MASAASISLTSPIFLTRQLITISDGSKTPKAVYCPLCSENKTVTVNNQVLSVDCGHLIACTECRDYNIEKVLRCENCCKNITGSFIGGCTSNCPRNEETAKVSALCAICNSHLRKEARCCRNIKELTACKKKIRASTVVFVQNPDLVKNPTPKDRPCSHFTLCQYCKKSIVKGHRSSTACKSCKQQVIEGTLVPPKKRNRVQFCLDTGLNQYVPPTKRICYEEPSDLATLAAIAHEQAKEDGTDKVKQEPGWRFGEFCRIPIQALLG